MTFKSRASNKLRLKRVIGLAFLAGLICAFPSTAWAAGEPSEADIVTLENRFFEHDYPKDTSEVRIERLEKMVFGEAKSGPLNQRLSALKAAVPAPASPASASAPSESSDDNQTSSLPDSTQSSRSLPPADVKDDQDSAPPGASYPSVSAIEQKLYGQAYDNEPIHKRLDRLETKVFGSVSGISDMTERVDRLKLKTGIDVAKQVPATSDWSDDNDFSFDNPPARSSQSRPPVNYGGSNGYSNYGSSSGRQSSYAGGPAAAPDYRAGSTVPFTSSDASSASLPQQVASLEQLTFGKTYAKDSLPARVNRLELMLFPQQPLAVSTPLPDRVKRLMGAVPGAASGTNMARSYGRSPDTSSEDDLSDLDTPSAYPRTAPSYQSQPRSSGLSKIVNSIGSMLGGGPGGGYVSRSGTMVTDPQTGLLYDQVSGALIDPMTGAVVGQRYPAQMTAPNYGYGGYGGYNSGFSNYGAAPYGMGYGSGLRFGFGGAGMGMGRMWP